MALRRQHAARTASDHVHHRYVSLRSAWRRTDEDKAAFANQDEFAEKIGRMMDLYDDVPETWMTTSRLFEPGGACAPRRRQGVL
jgi:hypothetical protein